MQITIQLESIKDVRYEADEILRKHWEEIALNKDTTPLDPNWELYLELDRLGLISLTTARYNGKLVGYFCYIVCPNLHYKSLKVADGDIFYIDSEYRGRFAVRLLKESEKNLKALGCNKIFNKTKKHFKNLHGVSAGKLFEACGYTEIESVFSKGI